MRLNAPKQITWIIANVVGILGILLFLNVFSIPGIAIGASATFWMAAGSFILLSLGSFLSGL